MTEVANYYQPAAVAPTDPTGGRLVAWAQAAAAANQLAKALCRTSFVPQAFQGNEHDTTAAVLMGDEVGLSPLAALRSIYVVHGAPAMYARTMVALVQAHGHEVWTEKATDSEVTVCGKRRGAEHVERSHWTIARARQAGYTNNKKYQTSPQEMLYAKAAAEVCRRIAADVLAGIPHSVEDLELEQPEPTTTAQRTETAAERPRTRRRASTARAAEPVAQPEPEFDDDKSADRDADASGLDEFHPDTTSNPEPGEQQPDEPTNETPPPAGGINRAQSTKLHALFSGFRITDRDEKLRVVRVLIGRAVDSSSEVTKDEATALIDTLDSILANGDDPRADLAAIVDGGDQ